MKKALLPTIISAMFVLMYGCGKSPTARPAKDTLEVSPLTLSFAYNEAGMPKPVTIETSADSYACEIAYTDGTKGWLDVSQHGGILYVTAERNDATGPRHAAISVIAGTADIATVEVTQGGKTVVADYSVTITPDRLEFAAEGTLSRTATITTAGDDPSVSIPETCTWASAELSGRIIEITVSENLSAEERRCTATVTNRQGCRAVLEIIQAGAERDYGIIVAPGEMIFAHDGDLARTASVSTGGSGLAVSVEAGGTEWLQAVLGPDGPNYRLTVTAAPNTGGERAATITVTNSEGGSAEIKATQTAAPDTAIALSPESLTFAPYSAAPQTVTVTTAANAITAKPDAGADWISLSTEGMTITVYVSDNLSATPRSANIAVSNAAGGEAALKVTQAGNVPDDLSGQWSWTARCTATIPGGDYTDIAGDATLSAVGGMYTVTGIFGPVIAPFAHAAPTISLACKPDGTAGVTDGTAFNGSGEIFYSGMNVEFPEYSYTAWRTAQAFAQVTVDRTEIGGIMYDRITFPNTITADHDLFPDEGIPAGSTGTVHYIYYTIVKAGIWESPQIREAYKDVVLLRPAQR